MSLELADDELLLVLNRQINLVCRRFVLDLCVMWHLPARNGLAWAALRRQGALCSPDRPCVCYAAPLSRDRGWPKVTFAQLIARGPKGPPAGEGLPHMSVRTMWSWIKFPATKVNSAKPNFIAIAEITRISCGSFFAHLRFLTDRVGGHSMEDFLVGKDFGLKSGWPKNIY